MLGRAPWERETDRDSQWKFPKARPTTVASEYGSPAVGSGDYQASLGQLPSAPIPHKQKKHVGGQSTGQSDWKPGKRQAQVAAQPAGDS